MQIKRWRSGDRDREMESIINKVDLHVSEGR
jgi:hypothetical protein